jgi:hypothetical protein
LRTIDENTLKNTTFYVLKADRFHIRTSKQKIEGPIIKKIKTNCQNRIIADGHSLVVLDDAVFQIAKFRFSGWTLKDGKLEKTYKCDLIKNV